MHIQRLLQPRPQPVHEQVVLRGGGAGSRGHQGRHRCRPDQRVRQLLVHLSLRHGPGVARRQQRAPVLQLLQDEAFRHPRHSADVHGHPPQGRQRPLLQRAPRLLLRVPAHGGLLLQPLRVHGHPHRHEVEHQLELSDAVRDMRRHVLRVVGQRRLRGGGVGRLRHRLLHPLGVRVRARDVDDRGDVPPRLRRVGGRLPAPEPHHPPHQHRPPARQRRRAPVQGAGRPPELPPFDSLRQRPSAAAREALPDVQVRRRARERRVVHALRRPPPGRRGRPRGGRRPRGAHHGGAPHPPGHRDHRVRPRYGLQHGLVPPPLGP
mmetsp:Transcript_4969/g.9489  ORF Transcript_4969/g.9489 Transcript_4969/m.9489 type:complete len:320 (+) Transcript_4969:1604-2563(+)